MINKKDIPSIVATVCNMYATDQYTIDDCCIAAGISYSTFYLWMSDFKEIEQSYKRANERRIESRKNRIALKAETALEKYLESYEIEEVEYDEYRDDGTGNMIKVKVKRKVVLPNPTLIQVALYNNAPESYKAKQELQHSGKIDSTIDQQITIFQLPDNNREQKNETK